MSCSDDRYEWPIEDTLFDNATGDYPPDTRTRSMYKKGRHRTVEQLPPIDDYHPERPEP